MVAPANQNYLKSIAQYSRQFTIAPQTSQCRRRRLAYGVYFRILQAVGATSVLLVTFLLPISALALGALALGERITGAALTGMALIGLGLAAIDGRPWREIRAAAARKRTAPDAEYPGRNPPLRRTFP